MLSMDQDAEGTQYLKSQEEDDINEEDATHTAFPH
jgi:hypothetical protein